MRSRRTGRSGTWQNAGGVELISGNTVVRPDGGVPVGEVRFPRSDRPKVAPDRTRVAGTGVSTGRRAPDDRAGHADDGESDGSRNAMHLYCQ